MNFDIYCRSLFDADDYLIRTSKSTPIIFSNTKGGSFSITEDEIIVFFTLLRQRFVNNELEEIDLTSYEEKKFRDFYKSFSDDKVSTLIQLGGSQTKGLTSVLEKYLCYQIGLEYVGMDNLHFQVENMDKLLEKFVNVDFEDDFSIKPFWEDMNKSGLIFSFDTIKRFISSIVSKQFVILTGLSGSGKTKLAEAFSKWLTSPISNGFHFKKGDVIKGVTTEYIVSDYDRISICLLGKENNTICLPFELINSWVKTIEENGFSNNTSSQDIQKVVANLYNVNPTLNSFHSPLKAIALSIIEANKKVSNFLQICFVSVGADWTNREPLLGYPNALKTGELSEYIKPDSGVLDLILNAINDPDHPYFLILDEMNLSHVERYFADFLSAMETSDGQIKLHPDTSDWNLSDVPATIYLPKNLFIIGTVNIDETTYMFSPKVLDRANVIEFRVNEDEINQFLSQAKHVDLSILEHQGQSMAKSFTALAKQSMFCDGLEKELLSRDLIPFFQYLKQVGAEFGFRTTTEISAYVKKSLVISNIHLTSESHNDPNFLNEWNKIIDSAIMQKLLPKLHGSKHRLNRILLSLANLCVEEPLENASNIFKDKTLRIKYALSFEKLSRMYSRLSSDGYTSYAEA